MLRQQHERERTEITKQHEVARAKMDQGLQEKLQQRRSRRARLDANKTTQNGFAPA